MHFHFLSKIHSHFPEFRSNFVLSPGQHEVGAGVVGPGTCGAPLDSVDFLTVGLQVMDT